MNTQLRPVYQLTKHAIGSLKEVWALSWPLMLGLFSASLMYFSDRLILAHHSVASMNAAAIGGISSWGLMVFPMVIAQTTEVFVGKFNGEGNLKKVATPVWQMLWLCLFMILPYLFLSRMLAPLLFHGTGNTALESDYFIATSNFAPCCVGAIGLAGFFIGTGKMKVVTYTMIVGNILNIGLDIILVFGLYGFPAMGCKGAGLATGLSQAVQVLIYLLLFLKKENREKYGSSSFSFDKKLTREFLNLAIPSGVGRCMEVAAHVIFFRIMIMAGGNTMTCATVVQSLFIFTNFMVDGLAKGATAIISNVYGADQKQYLAKILRSACSVHTIICVTFSTLLLSNIELVARCFFSDDVAAGILTPEFLTTLRNATFWMSIFFLFDGFCWIFFGLFTAAGDTKFVMYVNIVLNWLGYVLPTYLVVGLYKGQTMRGLF